MDPMKLMAILELVDRTVTLAGPLQEVVRKAIAGESITQEEMDAAAESRQAAVDEWNKG